MTAAVMIAGCGNQEEGEVVFSTSKPEEKPVRLSILATDDTNLDGLTVVCELAEKELNLQIDIEVSTGGSVDSRLVTGDLNDLVIMNSGPVMKRYINSDEDLDENFIALNDEEEIVNRMTDDFRRAVTYNGQIYGIPQCDVEAGGILYNKEIFDQYNLKIPDTWAEFLETCNFLKQKGLYPVVAMGGTKWTSQVLFLADYYNIIQQRPSLREAIAAGKDTYRYSDAVIRSLDKYSDLIPYYNRDYQTAEYQKGIEYLAEGKGVMSIVLTRSINRIREEYGDEVADRFGMFGVPGDDPGNNGITLWEPNAIYGNKNSPHREEILKFMKFYLSDEALDAFFRAQHQVGPVCIRNYQTVSQKNGIYQQVSRYIDEKRYIEAMEYDTGHKIGGGQLFEALQNGELTGREAAEKLEDMNG